MRQQEKEAESLSGLTFGLFFTWPQHARLLVMKGIDQKSPAWRIHRATPQPNGIWRRAQLRTYEIPAGDSSTRKTSRDRDCNMKVIPRKQVLLIMVAQGRVKAIFLLLSLAVGSSGCCKLEKATKAKVQASYHSREYCSRVREQFSLLRMH